MTASNYFTWLRNIIIIHRIYLVHLRFKPLSHHTCILNIEKYGSARCYWQTQTKYQHSELKKNTLHICFDKMRDARLALSITICRQSRIRYAICIPHTAQTFTVPFHNDGFLLASSTASSLSALNGSMKRHATPSYIRHFHIINSNGGTRSYGI